MATVLESTVWEMKGQVDGLSRRLDDMHRLLMVLIGVSATGLIAIIASLVVQILRS